MEMWEGAVLVVGGVALVWYMTNRSKQMAGMQIGAASAASNAGVTNASNLTTITNQAGGVPTVAGESLLPVSATAMPIRGTVIRVSSVAARTPLAPAQPIAQLPTARPLAQHLMSL
jgi:phosphopantothenoylcysteine synthetase/decarboxylase